MEDIHRDILRKRRDALLRDIEPLKLLNSLDVLDDDDREEVKMQKTRTERAETLLDMLTRKGPDAFQNFVAVLSRSQRFLADILIKDSGIDVSTFSTGEVLFREGLLDPVYKSIRHLRGKVPGGTL